LNIKDRTIFGVFWNGFGKLVNQLVQFIIMVVLAKLLVPADFGVVGIALIFTRLITLINELGIAAAIVQKKEINDYEIANLFTASLLTGLVLSVVLCLSSPYLASFFNAKILDGVLKVISITLIIGALGVIQKSLLNRELKFKQIANVEIVGVVIYGVVSIVLALFNYSVWSIVFGIIANNVVITFLFWILSDWKPKLYLNFVQLKSLVNFGLNVLGSNFVNYAGANIASFVAGKFLGTSLLGIYTLANTIINQTIGRISFIVGRVMFPALSKMQDDNDRYVNAFLKVLQVITLISFPFLIWITILANPFITVVFGEKWKDAIFPLQVFALVNIVKTVGNNVSTILLSKGRSDIEFKWNVVNIILMLMILLFTVRYGLNAMVLGIAIFQFVGTFVIQKITYSLVDLTLTRVGLTVLPNFMSALAMGGMIALFSHLLQGFLSPTVFLITAAVLGVIFYAGFLMVFNIRQLKELKMSLEESMLFEKIKNIKSAIV